MLWKALCQIFHCRSATWTHHARIYKKTHFRSSLNGLKYHHTQSGLLVGKGTPLCSTKWRHNCHCCSIVMACTKKNAAIPLSLENQISHEYHKLSRTCTRSTFYLVHDFQMYCNDTRIVTLAIPLQVTCPFALHLHMLTCTFPPIYNQRPDKFQVSYMSAMVAQISGNWTIFFQLRFQVDSNKNPKAAHLRALYYKNPLRQIDSSHKGPIMRQAFPCHGAVMHRVKDLVNIG